MPNGPAIAVETGTPPNASAIDAALVARLSGDATLQGLLPGGVYWDVGGKGQTDIAVLALSEDATTEQFGGAAAERTVYLAKAVILNTSRAKAAAAAYRIHQLLQWDDGPAPFTIDGYDLMALRRVERVAYTETDAANPDQRWQHQGGLYELIVAPTAPPHA